MTLSELRSEIRQELAESSAEVWTNAELNDYINDGFSLMNQATEWKEDLENLALAAASNNPSGEPTTEVRRVRRVTWDGVFLPQTSEYELDRFSSEWRTHTNYVPVRWYFDNDQHTVDQLRTYPGVDTADATDQFSFNQETGEMVRVVEGTTAWTFSQETGIVLEIVDTEGAQPFFRNERGQASILGIIADMNDDVNAVGLWYVGEPTELVNDVDVPDFPSWTHPIVTYYALFRCYEREGAYQELQLASAYLAEFIDWLTAVTRIRSRQIPDRVFSMEGVRQGVAFENRLSRIEGKNKPIVII